MNELDRQVLALCHTLHVHETGTIGTCDIFSTCGNVSLHLVLSHLGTDGSFFYREHATEATALILALRLYDLHAMHKMKQINHLVKRSDVLLAWRRKS